MSGWTQLDTVVPDGTGRLTFEDRSVAPGERYAYRLGWRESGVERFSAETWVDVPRAAEFALLGARPNPAVGDLWVWLTLPNDAPATLSLLDAAGRRVRVREVGGLGAGTRAVSLAEGKPLPAGVYVVQLTQAGRSVSRRVALIR